MVIRYYKGLITNTIYLGFVVHIILLLSVFDIYFKSPIIYGISSINNDCKVPAKRLILFVADGLRADMFFEITQNGSRVPFLRTVIESEGSWGISKTHLPTESRPGHVAMIAGFYEDPSAIFKGWKENPAEFDSVFNQSRKTYAWGSPDILSIFCKGSSQNMLTDSYHPNDQDFYGKNNSSFELNYWVLNKFKEFLNRTVMDKELDTDLRGEKLVLFFHLLGTDVSGHVNKPQSREYKQNIIIVDEIVKEIVDLIKKFYEDDDSVFVFTSDHGMTDWGSHGAGSEEETLTPLVVWGRGVMGPRFGQNSSPANWELSKLLRLDVDQADITPLMSALVGIPIPAHSVGVLPVNYINLTTTEAVTILYLNMRQIFVQYDTVKNQIEKDALPWVNTNYDDLNEAERQAIKSHIEDCLRSNQCDENLIEIIKSLMLRGLAGLDFYQNFYRRLLLIAVSMTFLGWAVNLIIHLLDSTDEKGYKDSRIMPKLTVVNIFFLFIGSIAMILLFVQSSPFMFYIYISLPIGLWWRVVNQLYHNSITVIGTRNRTTLFGSVLYIIGIEMLVHCFFYREVLSILMIGMSLWPYFASGVFRSRTNLAWMVSSLSLSAFPFLPVVGSNDNPVLVISSGCVWITAASLLIFVSPAKHVMTIWTKIRLLVLVGAIANIYCLSHDSPVFSEELNRPISWVLLVISISMLGFGSEILYARFLEIALTLSCPYILLSIGHEAFFTFILTINLGCWIYLEFTLYSSHGKYRVLLKKIYPNHCERLNLTFEDVRRSFFYIFYIYFSFFAIGNIASINSFDVSWVKNFVTVFAPFTMSSLILLKTLVPFVLVTVAFHFINIVTKVSVQRSFIIVLLFCECMTFNFFFRVTNKGSWLDIGLSISHYVITQVTVLILVGLYALVRLLTGPSLATKLKRTADISPGIFPHFHKD